MTSLERLHAVEILVGRVLFWGGLLSITIILLGLGLYADRGGLRVDPGGLAQLLQYRQGEDPPEVFTSVPEIARGLSHRPIDPLALDALGLTLLLATPVLAVAVAIPAFVWAREYRYALIASAVLIILVVSFFVGGRGG